MELIKFRVRVQVYITHNIYKIDEYFVYAENRDSAMDKIDDTLQNMRKNGLISYHDFFILSSDCF